MEECSSRDTTRTDAAEPRRDHFTLAASVIIASSQLGTALGMKLPRSDYVYLTWRDVIVGVAEGKAHGPTAAMALANLALYYALKWAKVFLRSVPWVKARPRVEAGLKAFPNAVVVVVLNVVVTMAMRLDAHGIKIVGAVPSGYPAPVNVLASPTLGADVQLLLAPAVLVAYLSVVAPELAEQIFDRVIDDAKMLRNFVQVVRSGQLARRSLASRTSSSRRAGTSSSIRSPLRTSASGPPTALSGLTCSTQVP
jgi:hypothetical protein